MELIPLDGRVRVSLAEAVTLIIQALPIEGGADVYMHILPDGTPDWDGPIELIPNPHSRRGEIYIDSDLPPLLEELGIFPRMIRRPIWKDFGPGKPLNDYSISRDEFVKLAECYGLGVVINEKTSDEQYTIDMAKTNDLVLERVAPEIPRPAATGPRFSVSRAALVKSHVHEWTTIDRDLKDASTNGLSAAKAGARDWYEDVALEWARSRGKLQPAGSPTSDLARAAHKMASLPGRKHTLKG